jgi:hypothetical protein
LKGRLLLLVVGSAAVWVLLGYPLCCLWDNNLLGGHDGLMLSIVAAVLCLIPTAGTLVWCDLVLGGSPEQQLMAVFGGTAIRIIFVIGVGMVLYQALEEFHSSKFWLWIIIFYLTTLTLEMVLVVRRQAALDKGSEPHNIPSV